MRGNTHTDACACTLHSCACTLHRTDACICKPTPHRCLCLQLCSECLRRTAACSYGTLRTPPSAHSEVAPKAGSCRRRPPVPPCRCLHTHSHLRCAGSGTCAALRAFFTSFFFLIMQPGPCCPHGTSGVPLPPPHTYNLSLLPILRMSYSIARCFCYCHRIPVTAPSLPPSVLPSLPAPSCLSSRRIYRCYNVLSVGCAPGVSRWVIW